LRSGGFNGRATGPDSVGPYDPETVDSFEAGLRFQTADDLLRINPTVFYALYNNKQEELLRGQPDGSTITTVFNASTAKTWGLEIEAVARPTPALSLRGAFGYLGYKYTDFIALDPRPGSPTSGQEVDISDTAKLRRAPNFTLALGGDYIFEPAFGDIILSANYKFTDNMFAGSPLFEVDPRAILPKTNVVDLSLKFNIAKTDGRPFETSILLYGRDVLHNGPGRNSRPFDALPNFYFTNPEPARSFGIELQIKI
ncbi:MAG: TonB-dependent receptor domain-containing protein, partial [Sandaracinobacteroides sp.]